MRATAANSLNNYPLRESMKWQSILKSNFRDWKSLADFLQLNEEQTEKILKQSRFPLNLPRRLAEKIEKSTLDDPIFKQFVPMQNETVPSLKFVKEPVQDSQFCKSPKLLHKYEGRALILATSACAMHCRYCFRQNFPYESKVKGFEKEIEEVRSNPTITEIILSGGDPLSLSNRALDLLFNDLSSISHLKRIRFHTRFPIGIPERIDDGFLKILEATKLQVWFVLHINHVNELDDEIFSYLKELQKKGVVLLNQAVLLKGINDTIDAQKALCESLVNQGILPYYLHQLDRVEGASHFEVPEEEGTILIKELTKQLPGYGIPKYVREIPGKQSKTPLL
ncbi:MAG: KamA family radical SAM protein [Waddliaceae bacterium]